MKGFILDYINENEYKKLERALKKYNMLAFKKLNFEYYPALRSGNFLGELVESNKDKNTETYELKLPSDLLFTFPSIINPFILLEIPSKTKHFDSPFFLIIYC